MLTSQHINWRNTLFLTLVPLVGIVGTILCLLFSLVSWPTWVLAGSLFIGGGFSISGGYHRLFAHKTYQATPLLRLLFVLIGSTTFEGSVLDWATDHRNHHVYTDTDKDPYNIKRGFWHAHLGWLFTLDENKRNFDNVKDLQQSRLLQFQHRYYKTISITMGFLFPMALATLWDEPLSGFIIAGALRITLVHHLTFFINSLCHLLGKQSYSTKFSARDNWLSALLTFGEGYHNYHHRFPMDYRNGIRFYHFDPCKWLIRSLSYLNITSNLRHTPQHHINQARKAALLQKQVRDNI